MSRARSGLARGASIDALTITANTVFTDAHNNVNVIDMGSPTSALSFTVTHSDLAGATASTTANQGCILALDTNLDDTEHALVILRGDANAEVNLHGFTDTGTDVQRDMNDEVVTLSVWADHATGSMRDVFVFVQDVLGTTQNVDTIAAVLTSSDAGSGDGVTAFTGGTAATAAAIDKGTITATADVNSATIMALYDHIDIIDTAGFGITLTDTLMGSDAEDVSTHTSLGGTTSVLTAIHSDLGTTDHLFIILSSAGTITTTGLTAVANGDKKLMIDGIPYLFEVRKNTGGTNFVLVQKTTSLVGPELTITNARTGDGVTAFTGGVAPSATAIDKGTITATADVDSTAKMAHYDHIDIIDTAGFGITLTDTLMTSDAEDVSTHTSLGGTASVLTAIHSDLGTTDHLFIILSSAGTITTTSIDPVSDAQLVIDGVLYDFVVRKNTGGTNFVLVQR